MKPNNLLGKLLWAVGQEDVLLVGQMHSLGANGSGNDGNSEAHALVDLTFHSGAKTQGRYREQAGFEKGFDVFHVAMGDDVIAGQTTDRSWHLAANDVKGRVG